MHGVRCGRFHLGKLNLVRRTRKTRTGLTTTPWCSIVETCPDAQDPGRIVLMAVAIDGGDLFLLPSTESIFFVFELPQVLMRGCTFDFRTSRR